VGGIRQDGLDWLRWTTELVVLLQKGKGMGWRLEDFGRYRRIMEEKL